MTDSATTAPTKAQRYGKMMRFAVMTYLVAWVISTSSLIAEPLFTPTPFTFPNLIGGTGFTDFARYYVSATLAASDDRTKIYDKATQIKVQQRLLNINVEPEGADNAYVPYVCVFIAPMSYLPIKAAYCLWIALSVIGGGLCIHKILKEDRHWDKWAIAAALLGIFGSFNSMNVFRTGQTTWFMFVFFALFYWALRNKNDIGAGLSLALATAKPQYCLLFVAGLLATKRWKAFITFCAGVGVMLIIGGTVLGWHNVFNYPSVISRLEVTAGTSFYPERMANIRGILTNLMPVKLAYQISFWLVFLAMPFVYKLWTGVKDDPEKLRWIFSLTVLLSVTFGPHVNPYDCLLIALPAILTLPSISPIEVWKLKSKPLKVWSFILFVYPGIGWCVGSLNFVFIAMNIALIISGLMYMNSKEFGADQTKVSATD
jgi:hypothetical protein